LSGFGGFGGCLPNTQFHALLNVGMCAH